jgi:hypothetical protein
MVRAIDTKGESASVLSARWPIVSFAAAAATAAIACSSSTTGSGNTPAPPPTPIPDGPTTFAMQESVPASSEAFKCLYVQMPAADGFIVGGQHEYTTGSHHLLLYRTDLSAIPTGEEGVGDCYESGTTKMAHIRGVVYASQTPTGVFTMPTGVGLPYKANDVLLFQTHYLNANGTPLDAHAKVYLRTQSGDVTTNASVLFFYDPFISVPAGQKATAGLRCPIAKDVTLLSFGSHYHARGVGYQAYLDLPNQAPATSPFYTSSSWANPNIANDAQLAAPAGSHIRFYCDYDNTQGTSDFVQGPTADKDEMCMFVGLYYPAMTVADDDCKQLDEWGTGTTSCTDTLTCLQACPSGPANATTGEFSPCIQKCMVASCPSVAAPLQPALDCIRSKCADACGGASDAGTTCEGCVAGSCLTQYEACANTTCP